MKESFIKKSQTFYATAKDYDRNSEKTKRFYATVQNKMHFAVHGHTTDELIVERAYGINHMGGCTGWQD